jgi:hypothetical protein
MLATMKPYIEALRALLYTNAVSTDWPAITTTRPNGKPGRN